MTKHSNSEMEIWDLYNANRELTGKTHIRGDKIPQGSYHLVVHVWIRNSKGEYLISQRSADRPTFPFMWECVGGSVFLGEDSLSAALRETKEEIGLDLNADNGTLAYSAVRDVIDGKEFNDILDSWLFEYDGDINLKDATTAEVAQTKWMSREDIKTLFDEKKFVHTLNYFFTEID